MSNEGELRPADVLAAHLPTSSGPDETSGKANADSSASVAPDDVSTSIGPPTSKASGNAEGYQPVQDVSTDGRRGADEHGCSLDGSDADHPLDILTELEKKP